MPLPTTLKQFVLEKDTLLQVAKNFQLELENGLQNENQMIKALPAFIGKLPSGKETGEFLAIDLGGSNFRVGCTKFHGNGKFEFDRMKWILTDELKESSSDKLFEFMAKCISQYLEECRHVQLKRNVKEGNRIPLGFTFSYPVKQEKLNHGVLLQWSKSLHCDEAIGKDVSVLLETALEAQGLGNIKVAALMNDTVATLCAHAYTDPDTRIGVILGTGTNAAYIENFQELKKLHANQMLSSYSEMVINIEWACFGDGQDQKDILPRNLFDKLLDKESVNPGSHLFEKMVSGLYMGEIARLLLCEIFPERSFGKEFELETAYLSELEDASEDLEKSSNLLRKWFIWEEIDDNSTNLVIEAFRAVAHRSANLMAALLTGLYSKLGNPTNRTVVAFDGSIYEHYPNYPLLLKSALDSLVPGHSIFLQVAKDESMIGAGAILATLAL